MKKKITLLIVIGTLIGTIVFGLNIMSLLSKQLMSILDIKDPSAEIVHPLVYSPKQDH